MPTGALRIRPVRRYRRARYPARWIRPGTGRGRGRGTCAVLLPAAALGLGCGEGSEDGGIRQLMPAGYFAEAEMVALAREAMATVDVSRTDGCPTLAERLQERPGAFYWAPPAGVDQAPIDVVCDLFAPELEPAPTADCPAGTRLPAFCVVVPAPSATEARPNPYTLEFLQDEGLAAVRALDPAGFAFPAFEPCEEYYYYYGCGTFRYETRADAAQGVTWEVESFLGELRHFGLI